MPNSEDGHCFAYLGFAVWVWVGLGHIAEERDRKLPGDRDQLGLDRIEELVEALAQNRRNVECAE